MTTQNKNHDDFMKEADRILEDIQSNTMQNEGPHPVKEPSPIQLSNVIKQLRARNKTPAEIASAAGVPEATIMDWAVDKNCPTDPNDFNLQGLMIFFLKTKIKSLFRQNAYYSSKKGAEKLGMDLEVFEELYTALLDTGELTYVMESPSWYSPDGTKQLRNHTVHH